MFNLNIFAFSVAALAATPAAFANTASPEADSLDYFVGDWHCHVAETGSVADPNGFSTASTERLRSDWFVTWVIAFHDGTSDKLECKMRYDAARKQYVMFVTSDAGCYGMATAKDWQDDALVFNGTLHAFDGKDIAFKKSFTKVSDGTFKLGWEMEGQTTEASLTCQK